MNLFYLPAVLLFLVFVIYPFIQGGFLSLTNWNGYSQSYKMVGLKNYVRLFTDGNVGTAFLNTLIYGFGSTLLQNVLGLALALFLNGKFRGRSVLRTVIYLPVMIAPLIMGYVMYFFFSYNRGAINDIVLALGGQMVDWMASGPRAVAIMTVVNALQFVGVSMVIYLAGLQNIPQMYYEAAAMDGIGKAAQLRYITLPLLMPAIQSAVVVNLIGGLKLFDIIMALTSGGPGYASHSLSTLVHRTYFGSENAGYASAIGLVSFLLIMVIGTLVTRYFTKKEVEM
ncbi:sugar ABC transporter permease [Lawsonibacter sp. NSJ-52]|uniref:Sugar ABC transporter permease n=2 Tax=Lawsonibacter faecis TaxID=2763052 RepID=A0A8J6JMD6_9FIRM|nr:sugar ABC transporter permease [Lawsonibacter faecis]MBC5737455.1 sugar ABC transporter permease [Lawsonibacter faecis]